MIGEKTHSPRGIGNRPVSEKTERIRARILETLRAHPEGVVRKDLAELIKIGELALRVHINALSVDYPIWEGGGPKNNVLGILPERK